MSKSGMLKKTTDFPRGRQIAYMIYDHFQAIGAHDAALHLSDLFNVSLQGDAIQDFVTRWDQALLLQAKYLEKTSWRV